MSKSCTSRTARTSILLSALWVLFPALPVHGQGELYRAIPPPGRALVFVFRAEGAPAAARIPVVVNTELVGELGQGTFVVATIAPGATELRIGERLVRTLAFTAAANQSYFVRVQALDDRTPARIDAQAVNEPEGRRAVSQSRLVGVVPVAVIPPVAPPPVAPPPVAPPSVARPPAAPPPVAAPPALAPPVEVPAPVPPPVAVTPAAPAVAAKPAAVKPAPAPEVSAPAEPRRESAFALIANAGSFKLADERQTVAGFPATYDTTSSSVFGLEAEWRSSSGFAVGGEFFTYKNDLVATGAITPNAQQKVYAVMLNGKYYFRAAEWLYPFVGIGVGQANASYSGGLTGNASGIAYQGMAGLEVRFKSVGVYMQYKHFSSETGSSGKEVKVGGGGILAGMSVSF